MYSDQASDAPEEKPRAKGVRVSRALTYRPSADARRALAFLREELGSMKSGVGGYSTQDILHNALTLYAQLVVETRHRGARVILDRGEWERQGEIVWPGMLPDLPLRDEPGPDADGGDDGPENPPDQPRRTRGRRAVPVGGRP